MERFEFLLCLDIAALNDNTLDHDVRQFFQIRRSNRVGTGENALYCGDDRLTGSIAIFTLTGRELFCFKIGMIAIFSYLKSFIDGKFPYTRLCG